MRAIQDWNSRPGRVPSYALALGSAAVALGIAAIANHALARRAERQNPPVGNFIEIDGVKLHYVERGVGEPLVLLHGNGSMIQDFDSSGLLNSAAQSFRVIAFDRPGFGHSARPRSTIWTPEAQAELIYRAFRRLKIHKAILLGHSWGASVALSLALKHPEVVSGLLLASGYYFPTPRADVALFSGPAIPVLGDLMAHTLSPLIARLIWPAMMNKIFGPAPIPSKFRGFSKEMAVRPSQLRASAAESALMIPAAFALRSEYRNLKVPLVIVAGDKDRFIDTDRQSATLHREIRHSVFRRVPGSGHMIHQTATDEVMAAIDELKASLVKSTTPRAAAVG
jgi:pimeloyl-ACP methyl ester carboxylesterase